MSFLILHFSVLILVAYSEGDALKCSEKVITRCKCGQSGNLEDVYVESCRFSLNESDPCHPCRGSCLMFLNCQTCSKHDCSSCPSGKVGPTCQNDNTPQPNIGSSAQTYQNTLQSGTKVSSESETDIEASNDDSKPKIDVQFFDIDDRPRNTSRLSREENEAIFRLNVFEFGTKNSSTDELIPVDEVDIVEKKTEYPSESSSNVSKVCTSNCSTDDTQFTSSDNNLRISEVKKVIIANNGTFNEESKNEISVGNSVSKNKKNLTSLINKISAEFQKFSDRFPHIIPLEKCENNDASCDYNDANYQFLNHGFLNSAEVDNLTNSPSKNVEENPRNDPKIALDASGAESPSLNDDQEVNNEVVIVPSSKELINYASPENNYVLLSSDDLQNEEEFSTLVPDERSLSDSETYANIHKGSESVNSFNDQPNDFSKSHELNHFIGEEIARRQRKKPKFRKKFCEIFPDAPVCHFHAKKFSISKEQPPREDSHFHVEHTMHNFKSPDYPRSKLLLKNSKEESLDEPTNVYNNQSMDNLGLIQQANEQNYRSYEGIHRPIPASFGINKQDSDNYDFNQQSPLNPIHWPPNDIKPHIKFQKSLAPTLFESFLSLIGSHVIPLQGRVYSAEKSLRPSNVLPAFKSFPKQSSKNSKSKYLNKTIRLTPFNFQEFGLFTDQRIEPAVQAHILLVKFTNENDPHSRIVPGPILSHNFAFELPMAFPALHVPMKESQNSKIEHPIPRKTVRRMRKLYKRRRTGVKEGSLSKCGPWIEDCPKNFGRNNGKRTKYGYSSKHSKKLRDLPGRVHIKFVKMNDLSDSSEIHASFVSNMSDENTDYLRANEFVIPLEEAVSVDEKLITDDNLEQQFDQQHSDTELLRRRRSTGQFCPIPKASPNGDLDCIIWPYKKACTLRCHPGYSSPNQHFTCDRSKNAWMPPLVSCQGGPEFEPMSKGNQPKPLGDLPPNFEDEEDQNDVGNQYEGFREEYKQDHMVGKDEGEAHVNEVAAPATYSKTQGLQKTKAHVNSIQEHVENQETEYPHNNEKVNVKVERLFKDNENSFEAGGFSHEAKNDENEVKIEKAEKPRIQGMGEEDNTDRKIVIDEARGGTVEKYSEEKTDEEPEVDYYYDELESKK